MSIRRPSIMEFQSMEFLMVIVAVAAVPIAVLAPVFFQSRYADESLLSLSNAQLIAKATIAYANDHDGRFPTFQDANEATEKIRSHLRSDVLVKASKAMRWNIEASGHRIKDLPKGNDTWLACCPRPGSDKYSLVVFAGGYGRSVHNAQLANLTP